MDRRTLTAAAILALLLLATAFAIGYMSYKVSDIKVREYRLDLFGGEEATRIVFISDAHVETQKNSVELAEAVEKINRLKADYIILGGDFAGESTDSLRLLQPLLKLENRENTFVVLGNHDYLPRDEIAEEYADWLTANNFTVLRNQNLKRGKLCFVGLEPIRNLHMPPDKANLSAAYEGVDEGCETILISHNPEIVLLPETAEKKADLMLSGHTHGVGSAWMPWPIKDVDGTYHLNGKKLLITSGLTKKRGFLEKVSSTQPEIALIEIR